MSHPIYYVPAGDVLPIFFSTYDGGTGASLTMTGLAVTDIEIYKDGSTTQRASDAGYTLLDTDGIDFDGITGIHGFSIDTGDNTDASFYTVGAWFTVVVSAVTVDGQTVNFIAAQFRIMPAESVAGKPKVDVDAFGGTAGTFASGRPEVNASHAAGTAWNSGAIGPNTLASDTLTAAKVAADVTTELQSGLATAAALTTVSGKIDVIDDFLDTEIAAIKAKTDNLPSDPADASDVAAAIAAVSAKIDTVDDFLDTEIAAIKAKTDSLTFTVAGVVDANVQRVNDVTVTGTGAPGDEWGS